MNANAKALGESDPQDAACGEFFGIVLFICCTHIVTILVTMYSHCN